MKKKIITSVLTFSFLFNPIGGLVSQAEEIGHVTEENVTFKEIETVIEEKSINLQELQVYTVPTNPYDGTQISKETMNELQIKERGVKKTAVVLALKYGGKAVSKIVSVLSEKNAKLVTKHSYELGEALDRFSDTVEARLVDYMIFELGLSSSSARSIAWAICLVAL